MRGVRSKWMHTSAGEIQGVAGRIQLCEDDAAITARELVARIPDPATPLEERLLRGLLLDLSVLWAVTAHRRAHAGRQPSCEFRDEVLLHEVWHRGNRLGWPAKRAFAVWAARHFRGLRRAHPLPIEAASAWIGAHSRERVSDRIVARAIGVHVITLRERFKATYGVSVHSYLQRARLRDVMRLLASGKHNVRSALYVAGWRSPKSLYAASIATTDLPLEQLRELPRDEWESRLMLPQPCPEPRQLSA